MTTRLCEVLVELPTFEQDALPHWIAQWNFAARIAPAALICNDPVDGDCQRIFRRSSDLLCVGGQRVSWDCFFDRLPASDRVLYYRHTVFWYPSTIGPRQLGRAHFQVADAFLPRSEGVCVGIKGRRRQHAWSRQWHPAYFKGQHACHRAVLCRSHLWNFAC